MENTTVITCTCRTCNGLAARVKGDGKVGATAVHNLVRLAHSPLARAASAQKFGPWPA